MERSFLDYAMSVIVSRALPDVRDGLKPVHRRILYDMHVQGYRPDRPHVKCAKVTGDTMSRFHPHGNSGHLRRPGPHGPAVQPAPSPDRLPRQLRVARLPAGRGPLHRVPAVASWPCTCSTASTRTPSTWAATTPTRRTSPTVLPARFPNLLVNGSQGIAVGMATNIPPHNLRRGHRRHHPPDRPPRRHPRRPDAVRQGPGLPDRGLHPRPGRDHGRLPHRAGIDPHAGQGRDRRGQGRRRADRRHRAALPGQPEGHPRADRRAGQQPGARRHPRACDDLSAGDDTKLVIGLKRDANANVVLNNLCKLTPLQTSFGVNMVALVDVNGRARASPGPSTWSRPCGPTSTIRSTSSRRRTEYRLSKAQDRAHLVEGLLKALNMIDADHRR